MTGSHSGAGLSAVAAAGIVALAGGAAAAADMPAPARVAKAPPAAVFDWTGLYGGVNYGTAVLGARAHTPGIIGDSLDRADSGYSAGAQIGANWQFHPNWVVGLEVDLNWLGIDHAKREWNDPLYLFGVETKWFATARGRLGYTSNSSLFYVTVGGAAVRLANSYTDLDGFAATAAKTASGWTAGAGIETALGGNWSAKVEYLYIDAGNQNVFNGNIVGVAPTAVFDHRFHVFRKALNYRFGSPGVSASALPAYNWAGFYAGVFGGVGVSQVSGEGGVDPGRPGYLDLAGAAFTGGAQVGYNHPFSPAWVGGIEADLGWLGIDRRLANWNDPTISHGVEADWYATARARFGRNTGPALLYITAGAAVVDVTNHFDGPGGRAARSETAVGWTWGGGIEAMLSQGWTAKAEYLYIDAGDQTVPNPAINAVPVRFDNRFHIFRFGVNRKFGT